LGRAREGTPKKGRTNKFCKWCKAVDGPFTRTHNTTECHRYNKDGSQKDRLTESFDSAKKPWKKPGSGDFAQMAYLTEEMAKLKKRLKKSKKHSKKRARDSLDSDSDSSEDSGSSCTGRPVEKHIKLVQPSGIHLKSTDTHPIKAIKLVLDTVRANEIAIENSKTGKVTAVVAILKVFGENICNSRNAKPGKLLNKPNKRLNSKKKHLIRSLKRHDDLSESVSDTSERLIVKQKTIRVLLDTGSSGDLLFIRKGSQKYIPTTKRVVPQSWGTSNGTFKMNKVGEVTLSFIEYSLSKSIHLTPDIVEYEAGATAPLCDLIIGKQTLHEIGAVLDFKEKTITIDNILLPMRNIMNLQLQLKPSVTRALWFGKQHIYMHQLF